MKLSSQAPYSTEVWNKNVEWIKQHLKKENPQFHVFAFQQMTDDVVCVKQQQKKKQDNKSSFPVINKTAVYLLYIRETLYAGLVETQPSIRVGITLQKGYKIK